jgi:hypothetical protein
VTSLLGGSAAGGRLRGDGARHSGQPASTSIAAPRRRIGTCCAETPPGGRTVRSTGRPSRPAVSRPWPGALPSTASTIRPRCSSCVARRPNGWACGRHSSSNRWKGCSCRGRTARSSSLPVRSSWSLIAPPRVHPAASRGTVHGGWLHRRPAGARVHRCASNRSRHHLLGVRPTPVRRPRGRIDRTDGLLETSQTRYSAPRCSALVNVRRRLERGSSPRSAWPGAAPHRQRGRDSGPDQQPRRVRTRYAFSIQSRRF